MVRWNQSRRFFRARHSEMWVKERRDVSFSPRRVLHWDLTYLGSITRSKLGQTWESIIVRIKWSFPRNVVSNHFVSEKYAYKIKVAFNENTKWCVVPGINIVYWGPQNFLVYCIRYVVNPSSVDLRSLFISPPKRLRAICRNRNLTKWLVFCTYCLLQTSKVNFWRDRAQVRSKVIGPYKFITLICLMS
jgi:hypothetical protein